LLVLGYHTFSEMKLFRSHLYLLLTIFIMAEVFVLDGGTVYHDELPAVANTEWVDINELPAVQRQQHFGTVFDHDELAATPKPFFEKVPLFQYHPLLYQDRLQLTQGYPTVFLSFCKSNIPHLNRDDEDPAFILG